MRQAVGPVFAIQCPIVLGRNFHAVLVRMITVMSVNRACDRKLLMPRHMCTPSGARNDQRA